MGTKKRCLLITNHFYPETFRCNDIAFELTKRGYEVKVLTAIPDYPEGKYHKGYSLFKKRYEKKNGVTIVRVPHIPRGNGKSTRMMIHYFSSMFFFFFHSLYQAIFNKYDCIFIHNTSPAFICLPAVLIKKLRGTPIDHWILDMWPESLAAGGIHSPKVYSIIERMMKAIYRNSDIIHISSMGFKQLLLEKGVPEEKIEYLPNFCEDTSKNTMLKSIPELPKGFIVMFAGNIGEAQNMENVMKSALMLKDEKDIHFVLIGDGRKKKWIEEFVNDNSLHDTVHLMGRWPIDTMSAFFAKADVMLVSLADEIAFNLVLPAKVQAYMVNKKPILGMLNGEGQEIIKTAKCGWCVESNDVDNMAKTIKEISRINSNDLKKIGEDGYKFYSENFELNHCIDKVEHALNRIMSKHK